jgi:MFS family permease
MESIKEEISDYMDRLRSFSKNSKLFLLGYSLATMSLGIFEVIFNLYILELGFSTAFLGFLVSSHLIASAVSLFPGGAISDRIGRKLTLVLSTGLMFWSVIILCTVQDKSFLVLANSMRGIGSSLLRTTAAPFMMEQSENYERMHLFSVSAASRSFSRMFGNMIGGFLPTFFAALTFRMLAEQYRYTLLAAGFFALLASFPLFLIKEKKISKLELSKPVFSGQRSFIMQFTVCSIIIGFGAGIIVPFFNVYFSQELHATAAQIGLIFSAGSLSIGIASLLLPFIVRKFGKVGSTVLTEYLSIPFLLLIMVSTTVFPAFVGYFLRTTLMNMSHPAQWNFYMDHIEEYERGKANSISQFGSTIFRALGSDIGGYLIATGSFSTAFQITAVVYIIGTTLFYALFRKKESL